MTEALARSERAAGRRTLPRPAARSLPGPRWNANAVTVDEKTLRERYELRHLGNGPEATGTGQGWLMSPTLFLKCAHLMSADPTTTETCPCGALHKDADTGRIASTYGNAEIEVFEAIPR
jgi:hypothetical protein